MSAAIGLVTPFIARLPAVPLRGWEWFTDYLPGVGGFLFFSAFNLIPSFALFAVGKASKRAPLTFFFALIGLVAFLLWAHGTVNLRSSSTAAIALMFIPVYGVGAVFAAWALGWLAHTVVKNARGRVWMTGIATALAIGFGVGSSVNESASIAKREASFPVLAVNKISLTKREVYGCCALGRVEVIASDNYDSEPGMDILVLGTSGTALLNSDNYAVKSQSPFAHQNCEGCVHMYPYLVPDGGGSFFVATSDGLSDSRTTALGSSLATALGRVENRLSPVLPHQTVHALLTHTAFRCSSRQGMHICPPVY